MREKKEKDPMGVFYMFKKIYPMCFKSNPGYFIFNQLSAVIYSVSHAGKVIISQIFFDAVFNAYVVDGVDESVRNVIFAFILFVLIMIICDIMHGVLNHSCESQGPRIRGYMNGEINKKSALIDPIEYENPKRLDDINKAANGLNKAVHFYLGTILIPMFYLPYFITMGFYLFSVQPMLLLSLLFVFVPVLISQVLRSAVFSKLEDEAAPIRREFDAYNEAASGKGFMKETRLLGSFFYLKNLIFETVGNLNIVTWKAQKRSALIDLGLNTLSLLGYGGILFLLVIYLLNGGISLGTFAAVFSSIGVLFGLMSEVMDMHIASIANDFGHIRNFLRFLDIPTDNRTDMDISKKDAIILTNVSFKYPNAKKKSLKNINLTINAGETIAIVGENGAGKTTLVKLLTGLYKPTEGSVIIAGHDVNDVSYRSLFKNVSGVFQKYQQYALTLSENVEIADFDVKNNQAKVERILDETNVDRVNKDVFPDGLETMLSRNFGGVELSGGQWQRVAIARGFYRNSHLIVLDEPTATIDPIEESSIYQKFVEAARNKTTIIVTHRMGSAKIAKRVVVMREGEIIEIGSHDELVKRGGLYAQMYEAQSVWYN